MRATLSAASYLAPAALIAASLIAGCSKAAGDPAYKKLVLDDVPTSRATAVATYFRECGEPDAKGTVICHACVNHMFLDKSGEINVYSDNNEHTIEDAPKAPHLVVEGEISSNHVNISPADTAKERAKGPVSFEKYLTGLFEAGNDWCAVLGGERIDKVNRIPAAARGKWVTP